MRKYELLSRGQPEQVWVICYPHWFHLESRDSGSNYDSYEIDKMMGRIKPIPALRVLLLVRAVEWW